MSVFRVRYPAVVVALAAAVWVSATLAGQTGASPSKGETEWRFFGSDNGATRYSPANQITADNVKDLRVVWRWSARNFGPRPATAMQVSPLIVDGVMYTTAGVNRDVVALDAATGQLLWHWRPTGELTRWFDIIEPVPKLRPRRHVLDGWLGRRADLRRDEQLHARGARREDRTAGGELRQERRRGSRGEPAVERAAGIAS